MGNIERHPASLPPAPAVMAILSRFDRQHLEAFMEVAVELMDVIDGDPDLQDTNDVEDDFARTGIANAYAPPGPGCPVSDPGDTAWIEWHTMRGSQKRGPNLTAGQEDDELTGDEQDGDFAEDEPCPYFATLDYGPGCKVSDPGGCEHDGRETEDGY